MIAKRHSCQHWQSSVALSVTVECRTVHRHRRRESLPSVIAERCDWCHRRASLRASLPSLITKPHCRASSSSIAESIYGIGAFAGCLPYNAWHIAAVTALTCAGPSVTDEQSITGITYMHHSMVSQGGSLIDYVKQFQLLLAAMVFAGVEKNEEELVLNFIQGLKNQEDRQTILQKDCETMEEV
eukprot:1447642-Rhodomonas_salina.1